MNLYKYLPLALVLLFVIVSCGDSNESADKNETTTSDAGSIVVPASNTDMARELKQIADNVPPQQAWNANSVAAEYYKGLLDQATGQQRLTLQFQYANQLLNAGKTEQAIEEFQGVIRVFEANGVGLTDQTKLLYELLAVAYLRKGEEENCCAMHNPQSCFLPIEGEAIHVLREGSEGAIAIYEQLLEKWPDDLQSRYLLNLAFMTLGEYPDRVPKQYLIPDLAKSSEDVDIGKFRDVAIQSRTDIFGLSGGAALDDFNNDGLLDILASSYGLRDQLEYLVNRGDGTFDNLTDEAHLDGIVSGLNVKQADYNNDGFLDVLVLRGAWLGVNGQHPNSLLRNNGDNTFTDVTRAAGIYSRYPTQTAVWQDFNLDGWVDVFIGNESGKSQASECELYLNNADGTFTNVAVAAGVNLTVYAKGVSSGDLNNDGWPDIFISVINGPNHLLVHDGIENGIPKFRDVSKSSGLEKPIQGFPCWIWDFDQDGREDIFIASYDLQGFTNMAEQIAAEMVGAPVSAEMSKLYRNLGNLKFEDVTNRMGLDKLMYAMGSNYGDIDNDGFDDFYIGNGAPDFRMIIPNRMFLNNQGETFAEVTYEGGFGHIQKGHGVSFGDVDNDGDQDIYCVMGGAVEGDTYQNLLFDNPGNNNNWITLTLEGTQSNRKAIGAKVRIYGTDDDGIEVTRYQKVTSGGSFGGSSLRIEAGLGSISSIERIEVDWPIKSGQTEIFRGITPNQAYLLKEGSGSATKQALKVFEFANEM